MATGSGVVSQAIGRGTASRTQAINSMTSAFGNLEQSRSNRVREALAEEGMEESKRSNLVREGLAAEGMELQSADQLLRGEEMQLKKDTMWLQQQPQWDAMADKYYMAVGGFDEQQADLLAQKKDLEKNLSKLGIGTVQMASTAAIQKIELELEGLEKARTGFIEGFEDRPAMMSALGKSTIGYSEGILSKASPYAISQMSDEESQLYQNTTQDQNAQYLEMKDKFDQKRADIQARQLEEASKSKARGTAEGALPSQLELQRDRMEFTAETAQQKVLAKATQEQHKLDVKASIGTVENTVRSLGKQINNMLPSDAGEFSLLGGTEGAFVSTAGAYYEQRPAEFAHDMTLFDGVMSSLAENHTDPIWMKNTWPAILNAVVEGGETFSGLSQTDVPNPMLPIVDSLAILSKDARFWKADARKKIGDVAISWQKRREAAAPKPEASSLPSGQ